MTCVHRKKGLGESGVQVCSGAQRLERHPRKLSLCGPLIRLLLLLSTDFTEGLLCTGTGSGCSFLPGSWMSFLQSETITSLD